LNLDNSYSNLNLNKRLSKDFNENAKIRGEIFKFTKDEKKDMKKSILSKIHSKMQMDAIEI